MQLILQNNYQNNFFEGGETMNIGLMQLAGNINPKSTSTVSSNNGTSTETISAQKKFDEVFSSAVATASTENTTTDNNTTTDIDLEKVSELLDVNTVEQVLDLLDLSHDQGLLMIQTSEDTEAIAVDELMDLNSLLSVLGLDEEQLLNTIQQLSGSESVKDSNLWELIEGVLENSGLFLQQVTTALEGENKVTPKQAEQLLQFLKLVQTAGTKSDLLSTQSDALAQMKELLQTLAKNLNQAVMVKQTETNSGSKLSLPGFEQVVKQMKTVTENIDTAQNGGQTQQSSTVTKTVSIHLPVEKAAQPEALTKEIQSLLNRSQFSNSQGTMKLLLKLYPENLGSIRIELLQKDGILTARMLTSTSQAKELLDGQLQQLKSAFAQAGIQSDRIEIAQSLQETDRSKDQQQFGNLFKQQKNEQEEQENNESENSDNVSFSDYLLSEVLE